MRKIGEAYLDQGKMWQNVCFEDGDDMSNGQFQCGNVWEDDTGNWGKKFIGNTPSIYKRRIPVENKVQQNAKKNLPLLKKMLLHGVKIVQKDGICVRIIDSPTQLLKDGEFFEVAGEVYNAWLQEDQIGPDKYAIFETLAEGKQVQFKSYENTDKWEDFNYFGSNCHFDAMNHLYRIKEEIPDTVIKWTPVSNPPIDGRVVYILHESGTIQTVQFWNGKFVDNGREMKLVRGWSYA